MNCFLDDSDGNVKAVLTYKRTQLQYDIENYAYIEGSIMQAPSAHNRHIVQDVGDKGNVDRITRVLDLAVDKCKEMLYPYTKHEIHRTEIDNNLKEVPVYGIVLSVPKTFSQTSLNLLSKLIHEYMVCEGVADWMSITNPEKAETWKSKSQEAIREVKIVLARRTQRIRRKTHPF